MIWQTTPSAELVHAIAKGTMPVFLGFELTEVGDDFLSGRLPVDERTRQPYGILHGGASVVLAETLGSLASHFCIDASRYITVGLEVNGNHIRQVREGWIHGRATAIHIGRKTHVWDIRITDDAGKLVHTGRLTTMVIEQEPK